MPLITRQGKGSRLTIQEMDDNLLYLEELAQVATSGNFEEVTYSELTEKIGSSELVAGKYYKITDFKSCYDQPNFDCNGSDITTDNYKEAEISPIIVLAISTDKLHSNAFQPAFPKDIIKYDVNWDTTEVTGGEAFGRITERIDEFNNRTDYDHRFIEFRRYTLYYYDAKSSAKTGTIQISSTTPIDDYYTANVIGTDTLFLTELSVNDIIAIPNMNNSNYNLQICKVTGITNDTEMTIQGYLLNTTSPLSKFYSTSSSSDMSYRQNNIVGDEVNFSEFTLFGNIEGNEEYNNNYFGDVANLQNENELTFILPNNVISDGPFSNNTFGEMCINNSFDDDMTNNKVGNRFRDNSITNDFDDNLIENDFRDNIIISDFQDNNIGNDFYENLIVAEFRDNQIGEEFHNNVISADEGEGFWRNNIGNQFYSNRIITYDEFQNNVIGNGFNNNQIYSDFYKNRIGVGFNNNTINSDFRDNVIGNGFYSNTLHQSFLDNQVDNYFDNNTLYAFFEKNTIGGDFEQNDLGSNLITIDFVKNSIGNGFSNNNTVIDFEDNTIGNEFKGNNFTRDDSDSGSFNGNQIGNGFVANVIEGYFSDNEIKNGFFINTIGTNFRYNDIGISFDSNTIANDFSYNEIGYYFSNNTIAEGFGIGGGSSRGNKIGNYFTNNTIGEYFYDNRIVDRFESNTIPDYFQYNDVKCEVYGINFDTGGGIKDFSYVPASSTSDGTYNAVVQSATSGSGIDAAFSIIVSGGVVTEINITYAGKNYVISDSVTLPSSSFNGTTDQVITIDDVSDEPMVCQSYNCSIQKDITNSTILNAIDSGNLYVAPSITSEYIAIP